MKIGADELILWLRKNDKATSIPNDGANGLGRIIYHIIVEELSGTKIEENFLSYWANDSNDKNIGKYNLPKTSAQYEIESLRLPDLYRRLDLL
jgi:hypothetical protein